MVTINNYYPKIQFKHFVEVPSSACVIATAHDENRKLKLFLIANGSGTIYKRNAINNTWDQLDSDSEYREIVRQLVKEGLNDSKIPRYTTNSLSTLN